MFYVSLALVMLAGVSQQVQDVTASIAIIAASVGGLFAAWQQHKKPARTRRPAPKPKGGKVVAPMSSDELDELNARR